MEALENGRNDVRGWRLVTRAPFHLQATVRVLQRRPANLVDVWDEDRYLRALATVDGIALIEVLNRGTMDAPDLRLLLRQGTCSSETRSRLVATVRRVLGLDVDPAPLERFAATDRKLRPTALALRGMRPPRFVDLFETFANVLPFQQLSLDAGVSIVGRLVERFVKHLEHDGRRFRAFPTSCAVADARLDTLRKCGLSARKAESLRYLARAIESGELTEQRFENMRSQDALKALVELPGIGPWSAGLVLLRGFGRLDVFPPGDVGAVRSLRALMRMGPGAPLDRLIKRAGESRGYLYFFGLGGRLLANGLIHPAPPLQMSLSSASIVTNALRLRQAR